MWTWVLIDLVPSPQVLDVLRIDDKKFSVTINLYFGVIWDEIRLDIR